MQSKQWAISRLCLIVTALILLGIVVPAVHAQSVNREALYSGGLSNLQVLSRYFTPAQRGRIPTLQAILHRVIYESDQATPSEIAIGAAIITGQPLAVDPGARGSDTTDQLIQGLRFKPLTVLKAKPAQAVQAVKSVTASINKSYTKIVRAGSSVRYASGIVRKPGGMESGYVEMTRGAKKTRIVEIPTAVGDLGVSRRAQKIAVRMASVQRQDPTWWSRIKVGHARNGEAVVSLPNGPIPWILTADASFAKEWNTSPDDLAGKLVAKIRSSIESSGGARGVLATPQEESVREKQAGDDAYAKADLAGAEQHYKAAIKDSPNYVAVYKLLVGIYKEQKKPDAVNDMVTQAQGEPSLTDDQIKEIRQAAQ